MALTAAEIRAVYSVDEGPLDKSLSGMGGKVQSTFGKVAAAAAGFFAFGKLSEGFFSVTGAASDLNETINKSNTIFGANAAAISQWAGGAAKNLGMSKQQALDAAAGFGDMFSQIGFAGDQAASMSQDIVQMSADLGSFNNLPTEDVAQRLSAAFRGEYDSLQALIPNINAARVEQEAMSATGKTNASELTAQEKAAAVLAIVHKDGARAMGDFAKTSDGAANSAKIATAEWNDQKAAIGQQLLPVLTGMIGFLRSSVIPGVGALVGALTESAHWISENRGPILAVAAVIGAVLLPHLIRLAVQSVISWTTARVEAIKTAATSVASSYKMIAGWVAARAAAVASFGQTIAIMAMYAAQSVANAARSVAAWVAAQARTVASLAVTAAGFIAQGAVMLASMAVTAAGVVAGWVVMGVQSLIQGARMAAAWVLAMGPVGWVIAAVIGLVALIVANWDTVVSWTTTAWNAVTGALSAAWEWIKGVVAGGVQWVLDKIAWFAQLPGKVASWFGGVKDAAVRKMGELVSWLGGLPGQVLSAIGNFGSLLLTAGRNLLEGLWNGISGAASWLKGKIMSWAGSILPGWVKDILGIHSPSTVFAEIGRYLMLGMAVGIDAEGKTAVNAAARAAAAITDAMQVRAPDLMGLANQQAMAGLTARRPAGVTVPSPGAGSATATGDDARGALFHADNVTVIEGTPTDVARQLELGARTRGTM